MEDFNTFVLRLVAWAGVMLMLASMAYNLQQIHQALLLIGDKL